MESASRQVSNSATEWLGRDAPFSHAEVAALFEAGSALLRANPYALSAPLNTQRARRADWKVFLGFCEGRGFLPLPAAPAVVVAFVETLSMPVGPTPARSVATLQRYLSTLAQAHTLSELPDPTRTAYVKGAMKALTRGRPTSQPMQALRWGPIAAALGALDTGSLTWDLRAKALLAVAYSTMARRAELVALEVEHLQIDAQGEGVALIYMSKVDREEPRFLSTEVVGHLKAWLEHAGITTGAVFRRIENTGVVGGRALHPQEVARMIQRVAHWMTAHGHPWPDLRLGAHSTRIGAAHDMVAAGIDLTSIMHAGGWKDPKMPRYYTRELAAKDSGMARLVRARRAGK
jgi:integrase